MCAWVKIDDQFSDHPKVLEVGPLAECLFVRGLTYASRYLTDGFVPASHLRRMGDLDAIEEAGKLVTAGLWADAENGYQIHDYLDYQPSAEKVKAEREAARLRMEAARAAKQSGNKSPRSGEVQANKTRSSHNPDPSPLTEVPNGTSTSPLTPQENAGKVQNKPKKAKPQTFLPDDFGISERLVKWAAKSGYTVEQMESQLERFKNNAVMKQHQYADWDAAFQNWMANARDWGHLNRATPNGALTVHNGGRAGQAVGRDGRTDAERGWREDPGPKGWTSMELARMGMSDERTERSGT